MKREVETTKAITSKRISPTLHDNSSWLENVNYLKKKKKEFKKRTKKRDLKLIPNN